MAVIVDYRGTEVEKTVNARTFSSTESLEDANMLAKENVSENGQENANDNGACYPYRWSNATEGRLFYKTCEEGFSSGGGVHSYVR